MNARGRLEQQVSKQDQRPMDMLQTTSYKDLMPVIQGLTADVSILDMLGFRSYRTGKEFDRTEVADVLQDPTNGGKMKGKPLDVLMAEVWMSMYNGKANLSQTEAPYAWDALHREVLGAFHACADFEDLRDVTAGDSVMSSIALNSMARELRQMYIDAIKEEEQEDNGDGDGEGDERQQQQARGMAKAAQEACDEAKKTMASIGVEPPEDREVDPTAYADAMTSLASDTNLKRMLEEVGRALGAAQRLFSSSLKATAGHGSKFTQGSDLDRLAHYSFVDLAHPALKWQLLAELAADEAVLIADNDYNRDRKGPVVIVVDESGSMDGQRLSDAKAVAVAAHLVAHSEHRSTSFVSFSSAARAYPADSPESIVAFMRSFMGGGTRFDRALEVALEQLEDMPYGADILLITDGHGNLGEELQEKLKDMKENKGLRLFVTFIVDDYLVEDEQTDMLEFISNTGLAGVLAGYACIPEGKIVEKAASLLWRSIEGAPLS